VSVLPPDSNGSTAEFSKGPSTRRRFPYSVFNNVGHLLSALKLTSA